MNYKYHYPERICKIAYKQLHGLTCPCLNYITLTTKPLYLLQWLLTSAVETSQMAGEEGDCSQHWSHHTASVADVQ